MVDGLARAWSLTVGDVLEGGSWALVVTVRRADGTDAVLKLAPPDGLLAGEVATLTAADGHGYARVHAYDPDRRAVLLEALGPPIPTDGPERVLDVSAATLRAAWRAPILGEPGPHKAARLIELIGTLWAELGEPCPRPLIDQSIGYARRRLDAAPTAPRVWCHGDPHPANLLAVRAPGRAPAAATSSSTPRGSPANRRTTWVLLCATGWVRCSRRVIRAAFCAPTARGSRTRPGCRRRRSGSGGSSSGCPAGSTC
ncbi:aminoglycoside phosphotransferase family protein [Luedemannella flava]